MNDTLRALAISAGILFPVVILIIVVSIAAVKRGAAQMAGGHLPNELTLVHEGPAVPAAKPAKAAGPVVDEISVSQILIYGVGLFTLTILALFALSLLQHMG